MANARSASLKARLVHLWPLLPAALFLAAAFIYPVGLLLATSFVDEAGNLTGVHYARLYESRVTGLVLMITFKIAGWTTLFCVVAAYPVAYLLSTVQQSTRNTLFIWVLMPFWTSFLVRTFAWMVLLGRNGPVNQLLGLLGVSDPPSFLYNFSGVMIGMVHALMPLCVLTMLSVMESIDRNLTRAASTLGARPGEAFWRVYFPLSVPGVAAGALLVFITSLGFFITPALLGSERETVIAQLIIFQIQDMLNWGFAGAIAVVLLIVALVIFFVYDRLVGLSTLSGGEGRLGGDARRNPIGWIGAKIGSLFIEIMARSTTMVGEAIDRIRPPSPTQPRRTGRPLLWTVSLLIIFFLVAPAFFILPVSFTQASFLSWPPEGFSLQWYRKVMSSTVWIEAVLRSFGVGMAAAALGMILGVPAAFYVAHRARYKTALIAFLVSPIIMPHIIIAVSLFYLYARIGLVGTTLGLVIGHAILAVPYVVVTVIAVLKHYDERLDHAAYTLGANQARTFIHITFPLLRAGLLAAFMFAFIVSFDELTIALFVTGGRIVTLPRKMWDDALLQVSPTLAAIAALVLIFMTVVILASEYSRRRGLPGN